jgi:predicted CXXCH cytochrome family protein
MKCHRGVEEYGKTEFHAHLDTEESCLACHNPHASNAEALLAAEQRVLCMRCHFNEEGRRDKETYVTHGGMDCSNCHTPHGAENPKYLATLDVDLCSRCHERAHRVSHPIGPDIIDPRTEMPMTCLSCHRLHGSEFEDYLALDPSMDLCIQCHQR